MKKLGMFLLPTLAMILLGGSALAQNVGDKSTYFVTYYSNTRTAGAPDTTVRVINDGDTGGNLWASFYVFDDSEELSECCSCVVTPDGLLSESLNTELLANPLTGRFNSRGVIKIVSSAVGNGGTTLRPIAGLHGTATHSQRNLVGYTLTEAPLSDANLVAGEQTMLQNLCSFAIVLGSGTGVCSCTPEDREF